MISTATISPCGRYRYDLWRRWSNGPYCMFVGLNPSTADETEDDPTIRRCISYAQEWGYSALCMANLFAYRATKPRDMKAAEDPVGPDNDRILRTLFDSAGIIIAAWGRDGKYRCRDLDVLSILDYPFCLKRNQDGSPAHPLYLRADLTPYPFQMEAGK